MSEKGIGGMDVSCRGAAERYGSMFDFSRIAVVCMYTTPFTLQSDRNYIYIYIYPSIFFTELAAARELHIALL